MQAQEIKAAQILRQCQEQLHNQPENLVLRWKEIEAFHVYKSAHGSYMKFLQQRSKCDWLWDGDLNTKLFHRKALKKGIYIILFLAFTMKLESGLISLIWLIMLSYNIIRSSWVLDEKIEDR